MKGCFDLIRGALGDECQHKRSVVHRAGRRQADVPVRE